MLHRLANKGEAAAVVGRCWSFQATRGISRSRSKLCNQYRFASTAPPPQSQRTLRQRIWRGIKIAGVVVVVSMVTLSYAADYVERQIQKKFMRIVTSLVQLEDSATGQSKCSGFVIDLEGGFIVTHASIVRKDDKPQVKVKLITGTECIAQACGVDDRTQVAVVKVINADLKAVTGLRKFFNRLSPIPVFIYPAAIGESAKLNKGSYVGVFGAGLFEDKSFGFGRVLTISRNQISDLGSMSARSVDLIETDHRFIASNIGGPLMNLFGQVVGINTVLLDPEAKDGNKDGSGHSFAVPIDAAWPAIQHIIQMARENAEEEKKKKRS